MVAITIYNTFRLDKDGKTYKLTSFFGNSLLTRWQIIKHINLRKCITLHVVCHIKEDNQRKIPPPDLQVLMDSYTNVFKNSKSSLHLESLAFYLPGLKFFPA